MKVRACVKCGQPITPQNVWTVKKRRTDGSMYLLDCGTCYPCHARERLEWQRTHRTSCRASRKKSEKKHPDVIAAKQKRYAKRHPELRLKWAKAWYKRHRDRVNAERRAKYSKFGIRNKQAVNARRRERRLDMKAIAMMKSAKTAETGSVWSQPPGGAADAQLHSQQE